MSASSQHGPVISVDSISTTSSGTSAVAVPIMLSTATMSSSSAAVATEPVVIPQHSASYIQHTSEPDPETCDHEKRLAQPAALPSMLHSLADEDTKKFLDSVPSPSVARSEPSRYPMCWPCMMQFVGVAPGQIFRFRIYSVKPRIICSPFEDCIIIIDKKKFLSYVSQHLHAKVVRMVLVDLSPMFLGEKIEWGFLAPVAGNAMGYYLNGYCISAYEPIMEACKLQEDLKFYFIRLSELKKYPRFPKFQEIRNVLSYHTPTGREFFVSHRWRTAGHPDPEGKDLAELQIPKTVWRCGVDIWNRHGRYFYVGMPPGRFCELEDLEADPWIWIDYCCMPQSPQTEEDKKLLSQQLLEMDVLLGKCKAVIMLYDDLSYIDRLWCKFEAFIGMSKGLSICPDEKLFTINGVVLKNKMVRFNNVDELASFTTGVFEGTHQTNPGDAPNVHLLFFKSLLENINFR